MFMRMIYDEKLAQAAYLLGCQKTGEAVVIDPERDVDRYLELAAANNLTITAVAETHIHADFLSGTRELAERTGATVYVSAEGGPDWSYQWLDKKSSGGPYTHRLLKHNDTFSIGHIELRALHTPGHTPEHMCFLITDHGSGANEPIALVSGDFLFVGDLGRPDLLETAAGQTGAMEPSARNLYHTLDVLKSIPDFVQVWPAHGAGSACGKALGAIPTSTVGYERRFNPALKAATSEPAFVDFILAGQPEPPLYFAEMKRLNKVGPPVLGRLPNPPRLTADQIRNLDYHTTAIADTRPWDDFRAGHLPGSLSFPISARSFNTDAGSMIAPDEPIVLVVDPAHRDEAVRDLIRIGLDHIEGWIHPDELEDHPLATTDEITVDEAEPLIARPGIAVLDVRRAAEFAEGHIDGATNIAHTRLASRMDEVPDADTLLINCRSGFRSARAAAYLERAGRKVINLQGGYLAWEAAHPVANHP